MKLIKNSLALLMVVLLASGCACRTKKIGADGDGNVPVADGSGPLKDVNFDYDSFALTPTAKAILEANAAWLKENAGTKVQVEGHCDERGTNEYNIVLGSNRAKSAADYLKAQGVEADRLSNVSYGEELPLDPAHNEEAWAKNRRAHFNVQK